MSAEQDVSLPNSLKNLRTGHQSVGWMRVYFNLSRKSSVAYNSETAVSQRDADENKVSRYNGKFVEIYSCGWSPSKEAGIINSGDLYFWR